MTLDSNNLLESILSSLDRIELINPDEIPDIPLYSEQIRTFMNEKFKSTLRDPENEKILSRDMLNNYSKLNLLPSPDGFKYNKGQFMNIIMIYFFKKVMTLDDIKNIIGPILEKYYYNESDFKLEDFYRELFSVERKQIDVLKEDIEKMYKKNEETFASAPDSDKEMLHITSLITALTTDVFIKELLIQKLAECYAKDYPYTDRGFKRPNSKKDKNK